MPSLNFLSTPLLTILFVLLLSVACGTQELQKAVSSYNAKKDYASLEVLHRHLRKGMSHSEVKALLGEPDYMPITGQEYYSTDRRVAAEESGVDHPVGLIADYRDEQGRLTGQLQTFWLAPITE